jgi:hypothetical protein
LPTTLEEWVRHDVERPENLLAGIGLPDDMLTVNGDVTLLCALGSPSWSVVEIQHLVEFATSLVGPLAAWSVWLRFETKRAGAALSEAARTDTLEDVFTESARVAEEVGRVRTLLDHLRSAQLMRGHRDRQLLHRFIHAAGIDALEASLDTAVESLLAQRTFGTSQIERIVEQRRKREDEDRKEREARHAKAQAKAVGFLEGVLALIAIAGLAGLFQWLRHDVGVRPAVAIRIEIAALVVITAIVAAVVRFVLLPRRRDAGGDEP